MSVSMENKLRKYVLHLSPFSDHFQCAFLGAFLSSHALLIPCIKHGPDESLVKALNIYACYTALNYVAHGPNVPYAALLWEMDHGLQGFSLENLLFLQFSDTDL